MNRRLWMVTAFAAVLTTACQDTTQPLPDRRDLAASGVTAVPNQYIVVFNAGERDVPGRARGLMLAHGGSVLRSWDVAIKGFVGRMSAQAAEAIARNPNVAYVEADAEARLFTTQTNPPWGLDRIDASGADLDNSYSYTSDGSGVNVYILDTGIRLTHNDYGGRASYIPNGSSGDFVGDGHGSAADCHGHGSHVAGTAAGSTYGVAKNATIWSGRVVNCTGNGQVSMVIDAVNWITANGQQPAAVNMSLGYGNVQSLRDAVEASIAAGFSYSVAAGNGNFVGIPIDACTESPGGAPNAVTVGATDINDNEASFSNYGTCVDILAPGVSVVSAWYNGDNATATLSGTSMATPHVVGAMARYLDDNPTATPAQVVSALTSNAQTGQIKLHRRSRQNGTANLLLNTTFMDGPVQNNPPTSSFTFNCSNLSCAFTDGSSDADGSVVSWSWDFGDGNGSIAQHPIYAFASAGTYAVELTVTDDDGATDASTQNVTVTAGGGGISLSTTGYKVKGRQNVDLSWSGAASTNVDVYRDGSLLATTANDGAYTDAIGARGGATYVYQVCEAGTSTCSNTSTVVF